MNKKEILKTISDALDKLDEEPEYLIADQDRRSIRNDRIMAELHMKDGKVVFFHFFDTPNKIQGEINRAANRKMLTDEPD